MQKLKLFPLFGVLVLLFFASRVYAANPMLVASIRDDAVITRIDVDSNDIFEDNARSEQQKGSASTSKKIEVYGVLERLGSSSDSLVDTQSTVELIHSEDDLEKFTKAIVRNNEKVVMVVVESDSVSVTRTVPAKLFWLFDINGKETAEVVSWGDGTSAVLITRPWWGRFSDYGANDLEVSNSLFKKIKNLPPSVLTTNLSANTKARIVLEIAKTFNENDAVAKN